MRGLFAGADAPNAAQLAAMGSRNALSPRRATALMRETLGHTTVSCLLHYTRLGRFMLPARTCAGITFILEHLISWRRGASACKRQCPAVSCHKDAHILPTH